MKYLLYKNHSRFLKYISKSQFSCSADGDSGRVIPAQAQFKKEKGEVALTWDRQPGNRWAFLEGWDTTVTERGHASHRGYWHRTHLLGAACLPSRSLTSAEAMAALFSPSVCYLRWFHNFPEPSIEACVVLYSKIGFFNTWYLLVTSFPYLSSFHGIPLPCFKSK